MIGVLSIIAAAVVDTLDPGQARARSHELRGRLGVREERPRLAGLKGRIQWVSDRYTPHIAVEVVEALGMMGNPPGGGPLDYLVPWLARELDRFQAEGVALANTASCEFEVRADVFSQAQWRQLRDWILATQPDLDPVILQRAQQLAHQWHLDLAENLEGTAGSLVPPGDTVLDFGGAAPGDGWTVQRITDSGTIRLEGRSMQNCLAEGYYNDDIENRTINLFSLRGPPDFRGWSRPAVTMAWQTGIHIDLAADNSAMFGEFVEDRWGYEPPFLALHKPRDWVEQKDGSDDGYYHWYEDPMFNDEVIDVLNNDDELREQFSEWLVEHGRGHGRGWVEIKGRQNEPPSPKYRERVWKWLHYFYVSNNLDPLYLLTRPSLCEAFWLFRPGDIEFEAFWSNFEALPKNLKVELQDTPPSNTISRCIPFGSGSVPELRAQLGGRDVVEAAGRAVYASGSPDLCLDFVTRVTRAEDPALYVQLKREAVDDPAALRALIGYTRAFPVGFDQQVYDIIVHDDLLSASALTARAWFSALTEKPNFGRTRHHGPGYKRALDEARRLVSAASSDDATAWAQLVDHAWHPVTLDGAIADWDEQFRKVDSQRGSSYRSFPGASMRYVRNFRTLLPPTQKRAILDLMLSKRGGSLPNSDGASTRCFILETWVSQVDDGDPFDLTRSVVLNLDAPDYERSELAYFYAKEVDEGPRDDTRQVVSECPTLAMKYAQLIDRAPHDVTRRGAAVKPIPALDYAKEVDRAPHPVTAAAMTQGTLGPGRMSYVEQYRRHFHEGPQWPIEFSRTGPTLLEQVVAIGEGSGGEEVLRVVRDWRSHGGMDRLLSHFRLQVERAQGFSRSLGLPDANLIVWTVFPDPDRVLYAPIETSLDSTEDALIIYIGGRLLVSPALWLQVRPDRRLMGWTMAILRIPSTRALPFQFQDMYPGQRFVIENTGHPYSHAWPDLWVGLTESVDPQPPWKLDSAGPVAWAFDKAVRQARFYGLGMIQEDLEKLARSLVTDPTIAQAMSLVDEYDRTLHVETQGFVSDQPSVTRVMSNLRDCLAALEEAP